MSIADTSGAPIKILEAAEKPILFMMLDKRCVMPMAKMKENINEYPCKCTA